MGRRNFRHEHYTRARVQEQRLSSELLSSNGGIFRDEAEGRSCEVGFPPRQAKRLGVMEAQGTDAARPRSLSGLKRRPGPARRGSFCPSAALHECGRRCRTLPPGCPGSTIRAAGLNFRVRDGIGCDPPRCCHRPLVRSCAAAAGEVWGRKGGKCSCCSGPRDTWRVCACVTMDRLSEGPLAGPLAGGSPCGSPVIINAGQATRALSTARLHALLHVHLPPINAVVFCGPSGGLPLGKIHLG
jgi:hypothetical protein